MESLGKILSKLSLCSHIDLKKTQSIADYFDNQFLPLDFRSICSFGVFQNQILVIFVINTAWANRLKYLLPDWVEDLQRSPYFFNLKAIQLKIKRNDSNDKGNKISIRKKKVFNRQISQEDLLIWNEIRRKIKASNKS